MRRRPFLRLILGIWLMGLPGSAGPLPSAGFLQSVDLKHLPSGGFSALHVEAGGTRALIVTDKGDVLRLKIARDAEGRITEVTSGPEEWLLDTNGKGIRNGQNDTEGLAVAPDGRLWISTEGTARVLAYPFLGGVPERMRRPRAFSLYPPNTAFEALALSPTGQLWLIPEAPLKPGPFPVYTWTGDTWEQTATIPADGFWLISDASFDDKGRLYVLERFFAGPAGFASRIRRFDITPQGPANDTVILTTSLGTHDNLEGLSVWRDGKGLVASMVSDDNFLKLFREELVEYRLPD